MRFNVSLLIIFFLVASPAVNWASEISSGVACIREHCYTLELAQTPEERARGLIGHALLKPGQAMLFVFESATRLDFWMKNMTFPIDIVWVGADRTIVHIRRDAPPCQTDPCEVFVPAADAQYVIEIPAGDSLRYSYAIGDKVSF